VTLDECRALQRLAEVSAALPRLLGLHMASRMRGVANRIFIPSIHKAARAHAAHEIITNAL
jgi:hypothetical protein